MAPSHGAALAAAAASGILTALAACAAGTVSPSGPPPMPEYPPDVGSASKPAASIDGDEDHVAVDGVRAAGLSLGGRKSCCKGKNDCKGKGMCKTARHACKGMNQCKGQGGCKPPACP